MSDILTRLAALTATDETGLLPCPFCSGRAYCGTPNDDEPDFIMCSFCAAVSDKTDTYESVSNLWNTRPREAVLIALVEEAAAEIERLRFALEDGLENAKIQLRGGIADPEITAAVRWLCESHGYGNVMATASRLWRDKEPHGAFAFGPCYATAQKFHDLAEAAINPQEVAHGQD